MIELSDSARQRSMDLPCTAGITLREVVRCRRMSRAEACAEHVEIGAARGGSRAIGAEVLAPVLERLGIRRNDGSPTMKRPAWRRMRNESP